MTDRYREQAMLLQVFFALVKLKSAITLAPIFTQ
jgi:hypothetical protein